MKRITGVNIVLFVLFLFSCEKNNQEFINTTTTVQFTTDSLKIAQTFETNLNSEELDSISEVFNLKFQNNPKSYFFYKLNYGRFLILRGQLQKADSLLDLTLKNPELDPKSIEAARLYNLKGAVFSYQQNQKEAVEYYQKALEIFESENDLRTAATIEFNLANMFLSQLDYNSSYKYSTNATEKLKSANDTLYLPLSMAISSVSAVNLQEVKQAALLADEAFRLSEKHNNLMGKLLSHYALGEIDIYNEDYDSAVEHLSEVILMSEKYNQKSVILPTKAALLKAYLVKEKYEEAIKIGEEAKELAKNSENTEIKYNLYKNLAFSYEKTENIPLAFEYLKKSEELLREKSSSDNQKTIQDILIEYETEKKERQIAEQELEIQKKSVQMRNWTILGIFIVGGFLSYFYIMRRNQKNTIKIMEKEKENEILSARVLGEEVERSRISKELHDGIASNLVAVKLQIENNAEISQKILSLVQETHKEVRQIAHNLMPINFDYQNLVEVIKSFCEECTTENRPVNFQTNTEKVKLDKDRSIVLYRVVQEFIQNAIKHSQAKQIDVLLMENDNVITLNIEDNGIGFDTKIKETSKGLSGVIERLKKINGHINIDSSDRGTSVFISIKS